MLCRENLAMWSCSVHTTNITGWPDIVSSDTPQNYWYARGTLIPSAGAFPCVSSFTSHPNRTRSTLVGEEDGTNTHFPPWVVQDTRRSGVQNQRMVCAKEIQWQESRKAGQRWDVRPQPRYTRLYPRDKRAFWSQGRDVLIAIANAHRKTRQQWTKWLGLYSDATGWSTYPSTWFWRYSRCVLPFSTTQYPSNSKKIRI